MDNETKMTQHKKILEILSDGRWHCTNEFYASYIADPRTRIAELKKKDFILLWQWCKSHPHNKSKEWQLLGQGTRLPPQMRKVSSNPLKTPQRAEFEATGPSQGILLKVP